MGGNSLLAVEENCFSFGFRGGSHDDADGLTFGEYRSIRGWSVTDVGWCWIFAEVLVARVAAARFSLDNIRGVAINVEAHVASVEPDDGVCLCGCVIHEHFCLIDGVGGGRSLLGADLIECDEYCGVDGTRDVEESANNALHARDATFIKLGAVVASG